MKIPFAFYQKVLAAMDLRKAQESQAGETEIVADENRAMKLESIVGQSRRDTSREIASVGTDQRCENGCCDQNR